MVLERESQWLIYALLPILCAKLSTNICVCVDPSENDKRALYANKLRCISEVMSKSIQLPQIKNVFRIMAWSEHCMRDFEKLFTTAHR